MKTYLFLLLLSLTCCQLEKKESTRVPVAELDVLNPKWTAFDQLVADVQCIPLESSSEAFVSDPWKTIRYKEYIYVYSMSQFTVFVFSNAGKLLNRLDNRKNGAYFAPFDIFIQEKEDKLCIIDEVRWKIRKYDLSGNFEKAEDLPFPVVKMECFNDNLFISYDGNFNKESNMCVSVWNPNSPSESKNYISRPIDKKLQTRIAATAFAIDKERESIYTHVEQNDTIYVVAKDQICRPAYHLEMDGLFYTNSMYPANGFTDKEGAKFLENNKYVSRIHSFYYASDYLFFHLGGKLSYYCAINLNDSSLIAFNTIFDELNPNSYSSILGSDGHSLIFLFKAADLLAHYKTQKITPSFASIEKTLATLKDSDNYVMMIVTIKPPTK